MIKTFGRLLLTIGSSFLKKLGFTILSHNQLKSIVDYNMNILENVVDHSRKSQKIDSIVFSKDRAMQLYAFLLSYTEMVTNSGRMYILYKCTNERHQKSYIQLMTFFSKENFIFISEQQFRDQLIKILEESDSGKIIFYVDDMIFTHSIDYKVLGEIDTRQDILSLSRGKDMDYSVVLKKYLVPPPFTNLRNNLVSFNWDYSRNFSDWTYPLGVSGFMYGRIEILSMLKAINFKAPNSLEAGMQLFLIFFISRNGLCTENASCICVHANIVQTEGKNVVLGTYTIDKLLDLWENGKRINVQEFYNKPMNITQVHKYTFIEVN